LNTWLWSQSKQEPEEKPKFPSLEKKIKKAKKIEGFFKLYKEDNQVYLALNKDQLEEEFYLFTSLSKGTFGGILMPHWTLDQKLVYFKRVNKKILLFQKDSYHKADKDSPTEKAVRKAYLDSLVHSFAILATDKEESVFLLRLNSYFFSAGARLFPPWLRSGAGISGIDSSNTFWSKIKAFPKNVELEIQVTLNLNGGLSSGVSNQSRFYFSLVKKEKSPYEMRLADDRIGFFTEDHLDFSNPLKDDGIHRVITRWHLEKAHPKSNRSVVKRPIVYHLDHTIPFKYRRHVRAGVLEWNKAFERLGFVGAIEVRLPEEGQDWDPSDIRYSTISWAADQAGMAIGPSRVNPETGEILDADIIVSAGWINFMDREAELYAPGSATSSESSKDPTPGFLKQQARRKMRREFVRHGIYPCEAASRLYSMRSLAFFQAQVSKRPGGESFQSWKEEFIGAYLKDLVMHEVGHTLGLRHNFKGSAVVPYAKIRDPKWNETHQISSSVMDYTDLYVAVDPKDQRKYMNDSLGEYDYLAIEYGYKPFSEKDREAGLDKIAKSLREKNLDYGTDEDAYYGNDPLIHVYDLGDDLIEAGKDRLAVIQRLLKSVEKEMVTTGDRFFEFRSILNGLLYQYIQKSMDVARYMGGIHVYRDHVNDPAGRLPFEPVSYENHLRALDFFKEFVFQDDVLEVPPSLLSKARQNSWEWAPNGPVPVEAYLRHTRRAILQTCLAPDTLMRLSEYHEKVDKKPFTQALLFEKLYEMVFGELDSMREGTEFSLSDLSIFTQKTYVEILGNYLRSNTPLPGKSRLYLRHTLDLLKEKLGSVLSRLPDSQSFSQAANRIHFKDLLAMIKRIESAIMIQN